MPRGEAVFAKVNPAILYGQRFTRLSPAYRFVYLALWLIAVRDRTAVLPGNRYGYHYVAKIAHIEQRFGKRAITKIAEERLITLMPDETIIVEGIVECHAKLKWNNFPIPDIWGKGNFPETSPKRGERSGEFLNPEGEIYSSGNNDSVGTPEGAPEDGQTARSKSDQSSSELSQEQDEDAEPWNKPENSHT